MTVDSTTTLNDPMIQYTQPLRYLCSTVAVTLLTLVAIVSIGNVWCTMQLHPVGLFIILILCLLWLAYVEGLHYGVVSLEKRDLTPYKEVYPRAYETHKLVNDTKSVKKFLVGRQFFTIFIVFVISQITSFPHIPANFAGMPTSLVSVLIQTGLPGVAITLTFGQLISQLYVEQYTLSFNNMIGCNFVTQVCLGAEYVGICHFSHLLFHFGSRLFCGSVRKAEDTMRTTDNLVEEDGVQYIVVMPPSEDPLTYFDVIRYAWSTVAVLGSLGIIFYGISQQKYVLPTPPGATFVIFFLALTMLFYLEGLMIAIVAIQYWDRESFKDSYPRAYMVHELVTRPDNVKRFIIGRQFCTVLTNFLIAQATTFAVWDHGSFNKYIFYIGVQSGLVGVMVVLSFGQLMPELLAAQYPLRFVDMYGTYSVTCICMFFDAIGVGHCAWLIHYTRQHLWPSKEIALDEDEKPSVRRIKSAELLAATGSPTGSPTGGSSIKKT